MVSSERLLLWSEVFFLTTENISHMMHLNGVVVKIPAMIFPRPCRSKALAVLAQVESTRWATHDVMSDTWRSANCSRMVCLVSPSGMGSVSGRTSKSQAVLSTACQEWPLQHVAEPHWPGATFVGSMKTLPGSTALLQSRTSVFLLGTDDVCELVQSCQQQKTKSSDPHWLYAKLLPCTKPGNKNRV